MKLDKYEGVTAEYKYKEGVLTLLEKIIEILDRDNSEQAKIIKEEILKEEKKEIKVKKARKKKGDM